MHGVPVLHEWVHFFVVQKHVRSMLFYLSCGNGLPPSLPASSFAQLDIFHIQLLCSYLERLISWHFL